MKLLHVVPTYLPATRYGGTIYSVHGLCKALSRHGNEVHVYTTNVDGRENSRVPLAKPVNLDGVNVWYFNSGFFRRYYWSPMMAWSLKKNINQFDIVHIHAMFLYPVQVAARIARNSGVPYLVSPRGMLVKELVQRKNKWLKTIWIELLGKKIIGNAAAIHVTSGIEKHELQEFHFNIKKTAVIPNGIDIDSGKPSETISPDIGNLLNKQPLILSLGRINWKKGLERLIHSMKMVPNAHLAIAGNDEEGYAKRLHDIVSQNGLDDRVTILPREVTGPDKKQLFANAKVFALVSFSENFGNVALEAMSYYCPVVTTENVGVAEIINENKAGMVVEGGAGNIAKALNQLLSDEKERKTMGGNAYKAVINNYTWNIVSKRFQELYLDINKNF